MQVSTLVIYGKQTAKQGVTKEGLFHPSYGHAANGELVHKLSVRSLHGDAEVRAVVDMSVEIEVDGVHAVFNPLLYLPSFGVF